MTASNFDSKLDDALNRLREGVPAEPAVHDAAEIAGLVSVARQVTVLAPAPPFHLAEGRLDFLNEAERVAAQRSRSRWRWGSIEPRPVWLATIATILLLTGAAFTLMMMSGRLDTQSPTAPSIATPIMSPTYTATPTRMARRSTDGIPLPVVEISIGQLCAPQPEPIPVPVHPVRSTVTSNSELVRSKCLKL